MTTDYSAAIDAVFGPKESAANSSPLTPAGAVDTSGGISAALDAEPGMLEQRARETLTPAPRPEAPEFPWSNPTAAWYTPPEEKPAGDVPTANLRLQMAEREFARHELLPEGPDDDFTGALLRASFMLNAASRYKPDEVFIAAQASSGLGMPLDMTLDNLDKARDMLAEYTPAKVRDFAPGFLRLVQHDYDSAMLWRHDIATGNAIASAFDAMPDYESRLAALGRGVSGAGTMLLQQGINLGRLGLEGLATLVRGVDENYQPADLADRPIAAALLETSDTMRDWVRQLSERQKEISAESPLAGQKVWDTPEVLLDSRWWIENTPQAAASFLPILAAYARGGKAAAGLAGLFMNGNEVYTDLLDTGMEDNAETRLWSLMGGAAMGALDVVGLTGIFGGKPAVKEAVKNAVLQAAKGGIKAAAYVGKRAGMGYLFEGGTEYAQNLVKAGVEAMAKGKDFGGVLSEIGDAATQLEDFILGGLMGGVVSGAHAGAQVRGEHGRQALLASIEAAAKSEEVAAARAEVESVIQDNAEAQQRMAFAQSLAQTAEAADSSALRQADPATFEREAEKLIPEGARSVWLDVDMVQEFIEEDGARLEALGLTAREVADALQIQAGAVKVSTTRLVSRFQGEERALLLQNARMTPGGMTLSEAQAFDPQKRAEAAAERIRARNSVNAEAGRERTRLKNEFVQAGYAPHMAEQYATLHAEQARTFADRYGMDAATLLRERSIVRGEPGDIGDNALYHPMNPGVDLDAPVKVVTVQPRFEGQNLWTVIKGKGRKALRDAVVGVYTNRNTGWTIKVTGYGADHAISSATRRGVGGVEHMEAVVNLPSLIENAALVESHSDKKGQGLANVHRMYAPMALGKDMYAVKLTVKESPEGMVAAIEDVRKLYDVSLEKKMPGDLFAPPPDTKGTLIGSATPTPGISGISLRSLLEDVNDSKGNRFFQPMNSSVDLDAPVKVVTVQPRFEGQNAKVLRKRFPKEVKGAVLEAFKAGVINEDTGLKVGMTASDFKEHLKLDDGQHELEHMEAIAALPELMRTARLVESHKDKKPSTGSNLKQVHRFMSALRIGGNEFAVMLTVKEFKDGSASLNMENPVKLYHHRIEKALSSSDTGLRPAMPTTTYQKRDVEQSPSGSSVNINAHEYSLRSLLEDVNDSEGNPFFQQQRGAVSFGSDGKSVTSIFKDASDLSTPIHEGAHVFINDLIRVVMDGGRMAEQLWASEFSAVSKDASIDDSLRQRRQRALTRRWNKHKIGLWQAREDLAALVENANAQREAHGKAIGLDLPPVTLEEVLQDTATPEQLRTLQEVNAVSFEGYVREGKAPSTRLEAVFHKMRQWLAAIYRLAGIHGVKVTPEVRRVFDRMLANDEAIRKSAAGAALAGEGEFLAAVQEAEAGLTPDESGEWTRTYRINYAPGVVTQETTPGDSSGARSQLVNATAVGIRKPAEAGNGYRKAALNQESEYERLQDLYDRAEADVTARMDKATLQDRNKRWKAYYDEGKEIARGDVFYEIMAALSVKEGNPWSGISRDWLERQYGKAAVADFLKTAQGRRIISRNGGVALDAVGIGDIVGGIERAHALGLTDADGLYNYLLDNVVVRRRNMVNDARAYADQRMADDDARAEAAGNEPGEAYRKYLEEVEATVLRLAARRDSGWRTKEQQARWVEEHRTPLAEVRRRVKAVLRGKKLRDIQPNQFVGEVRKALQERNAALAAGNAQEALTAVDRARVALESWIEANRVMKERQTFEKNAARLAALKRDVVLPEAWSAIQDTLERFRLVPARKRMEGESVTLYDAVASLCEDAAEINGMPAIAEWLLNDRAKGRYLDLTPERLQDVKDVLAMLEHMGRQGLAANRESEAAKIREVAESGALIMSGLKVLPVAREGTAWHQWQRWMRSFFGNMLSSIQWQLRQADGFSNLGPKGQRGINEERIWGSIVDGEARYQVRMSGLKERLNPIFKRLVGSAKSWEAKLGKTFAVNGKPLPVPEIMRRGGKLNWTSDRVLALALNLGNEGNVRRLREGYPDLSPETLSQLIGDDATRLVFPYWQGRGNDGLLSAQDWRDVQEIGNVLHGQWADIQATHKKMFGFAPRGVDTRPMSIRVGGQTLNLEGWYYPAVYDAALSPAVKKRQEQQDALVRTEAVCAAPAAKRGFTKSRTNSGGGAPLLLETGIVMSHLNDVCRFIELAEIARFADRVTRAPQWAQAYIRAFGREDYDSIRPNLKGLVLEERPPADAISKSADWLRERLVPWGLAFNLKTAILQSTAVFPAMHDLGASNTMRGISAVAKGGYALIKEIWGISPYMKSRAANIDQDLRKSMRGIDARTRQKVVKLLGKELTWNDVVEAGMLPLISVDMATSSAIWMAAYNKEMAALMNSPAGKPGIDPSSGHHAAAVRAADMAVKAVNPDFNPSSRSQFLRSRGMVRFLNMFSSAVVLFAQRRAYNAAALRQAWGKASSAGDKVQAALQYARYEMYDFALQGVAMGIILSLAYGEDDPEKWGKNVAGAWLDAAAMRVPVFGSPVAALITGETWRGISMIYDQPWQMAKRTSGAIHKSSGNGLALSLADIISFELKVPASRLGRNAVRGYEQWQKGEGTPLSPLMPRPNSY